MLHNSCVFFLFYLWSSDSLCVEKTSTNKQPFQGGVIHKHPGKWKMGPWKMNFVSKGAIFHVHELLEKEYIKGSRLSIF